MFLGKDLQLHLGDGKERTAEFQPTCGLQNARGRGTRRATAGERGQNDKAGACGKSLTLSFLRRPESTLQTRGVWACDPRSVILSRRSNTL